MECAQPLFFRFRPAMRHPLVSSSRGDAIVPRVELMVYATGCGIMALNRGKLEDARGAGTDYPPLQELLCRRSSAGTFVGGLFGDTEAQRKITGTKRGIVYKENRWVKACTGRVQQYICNGPYHTKQGTCLISRYNNGLRPRLVLPSVEQGSSVRHDTHLEPIDICGFNEDESKVRESLLDELLLLFVLGASSGGNGFWPLLRLVVSPFHRTPGRGTTPAGSQVTAEAIKDLNPFSLPIETALREPLERDVPS